MADLSEDQVKTLQWQNPGADAQRIIFAAIKSEAEEGRTLQQSWEKTKEILAGREMLYLGNPGQDDTADTAYSLLFAKGDPALNTVLAGVAYQQLVLAGQSAAERMKLREKGYYGMTVRGVGPFWEDRDEQTRRTELTMSEASASLLQYLLPEQGKMHMPQSFRSAGHVEVPSR